VVIQMKMVGIGAVKGRPATQSLLACSTDETRRQTRFAHKAAKKQTLIMWPYWLQRP
jgi:hypothetical protein